MRFVSAIILLIMGFSTLSRADVFTWDMRAEGGPEPEKLAYGKNPANPMELTGLASTDVLNVRTEIYFGLEYSDYSDDQLVQNTFLETYIFAHVYHNTDVKKLISGLSAREVFINETASSMKTIKISVPLEKIDLVPLERGWVYQHKIPAAVIHETISAIENEVAEENSIRLYKIASKITNVLSSSPLVTDAPAVTDEGSDPLYSKLTSLTSYMCFVRPPTRGLFTYNINVSEKFRAVDMFYPQHLESHDPVKKALSGYLNCMDYY